jgi:hypothetical protein
MAIKRSGMAENLIGASTGVTGFSNALLRIIKEHSLRPRNPEPLRRCRTPAQPQLNVGMHMPELEQRKTGSPGSHTARASLQYALCGIRAVNTAVANQCSESTSRTNIIWGDTGWDFVPGDAFRRMADQLSSAVTTGSGEVSPGVISRQPAALSRTTSHPKTCAAG